MRKILLILLVMLVQACDQYPVNHDSQGNVVSYADLEDSYVLINYWAEWCGPCLEEIPELNRLDQEIGDLTVIGISYDQPPSDELNRQIKELGIEFPVVVTDPSGHLGFTSPEVLPTTYVFSPGLELRSVLVGPQTEESIKLLLADYRR